MYNYNSDWERSMRDEERKLLREVSTQRGMSWNKFGKMIKLNALMSRHRDWNRWNRYY